MSEATETSAIFTAIKTFYGQHSNYVLGTGSLPSYTLLIDDMIYPDLVTFCVNQVGKGSGYDAGVAQEVISTGEATLREIDLISTRKSNIYSAHAGECEEEEGFYDQSQVYSLGVLKGAPTQGSQS